MLIKKASDIRSSEITPEHLYWNRRQFIQTASGAALGAAALLAQSDSGLHAQEPLGDVSPSPFSTNEPKNSYDEITSSVSTRATRNATPTS